MRILKRLTLVSPAVLVIASLPATASATLIAYEPFDGLINGNLAGQGSGFGWGDWNGELADDKWKTHANGSPGNVTVESGALGYTDAAGNVLEVQGSQKARAAGTASSGGAVFRPIEGAGLPPDILPEFGTLRFIVQQMGANSYYTSFLAKREGQTDAQWKGGADPDGNPYSRNSHFTLHSRPTTESQLFSPGEEAVIGNTFAVDDDNEWFFSGGDTHLGTGVTFGGGDQRFVVLKISFGSGSAPDEIEMWLDPNLESEAAANGANLAKVMADFFDDGTAQFQQGAVGLAAGRGDANRAPGDIIFDEIRIGTTWDSVTPIFAPQPGTTPGDFNGDDVVNAIDYAVWREAYAADPGGLESTYLAGNGDGENGVDQGDFTLWLASYGTTAEGAPPAVPEPSAATVLIAAGALLGAWRARHR